MPLFRNDYSEGAHPAVLEALINTNLEQSVGYGEDDYCAQAKQLILAQINVPNLHIRFIPGGTQTNLIALAAALRSHEAVVAADTAHISTHETGAIEACGHKILLAHSADGKLKTAQILSILAEHDNHHMVKPRLVYISNSTELGTIYTKDELSAIYQICQIHNLLLYIDGARLASALTCADNDLSLSDIANLSDAFSIGGTKNGALFGEALIMKDKCFYQDIDYHIKQRGAMLAKGRLLGLQFKALFSDDLYWQNAKQANHIAAILQEGIAQKGYPFLTDSPTNQLFVICPANIAKMLTEDFGAEPQPLPDADKRCVRLVTSWASTEKDALFLLKHLPKHP